MAVRAPLYLTAGNQLQEMTTAEVTDIVEEAIYQYGQNPSVTLSVNASATGGSLNSQISDTRFRSGAVSSSSSSFPGEGTTQEPVQVTTNWKRLSQANASVSPTADTGKTWPVYRTAMNQIQATKAGVISKIFVENACPIDFGASLVEIK